ncbi:unnamed protein product [Vitrella brassicaformis CCMP3155]|uniref:Uncharacterized protein n=1 Tax=Vitrella brassicaformis (strain CCMP3155) TaxID=1169540 RepID=A0A0G4GTZ6_VITBC|nr:unnamed protein product [Vitrella brassicaformis CCMP3155]|eukprot:CEM34094.1 unnamed protein product [Vitrella brassicaformis CCMP3155]
MGCSWFEEWSKAVTNFKHKLTESIDSAFERYTGFVYDHPCWFIWIPAIVSIAMGSAWILREAEANPRTLYAKPTSDAMSDLALIQERYGDWPRVTFLLFVGEDGKNLLDEDVLYRANQMVEGLNNRNVTVNGKEYPFDEVCVKGT